jgi:hypothetical protein
MDYGPNPSLAGRSVVDPGPHAARFSSSSDQVAESAVTRWSMSCSVCSGDGVMRKRSVPSGTVG